MRGYSRVLVTGGAGFIGSHVVDRLLEENIEVIVLDNLEGGRKENIKQHEKNQCFHFKEGDIRSPNIVRRIVPDVEAIVHMAALVSVSHSIKDPVLVNDVNVGGTVNLLKAATESGVRRFVYASSCAIYGNPDTLPIKEDCVPRPTSPYGASKLAAENYVTVFHEISGLETVSLRFFNVFGPRQAHSRDSSVTTQFVNRLAGNLPLVIYGSGEQTRDFVHVRDVAEASMLALMTDTTDGDTFNIGTGVATSINRLAGILLEAGNKTSLKTIFKKPREGDIEHSVADISKARKILSFNPNTQLEVELKKLAKGYGI